MPPSTGRAVDIAELLDGGSWSTYQKLLIALAALAIIFDGFDIQILGFAIPSLIREWHVARAEFGPVLAVGLAGMALGGVVAGQCGDRWGRRTALIASVTVFGLATIATAFVHGFAGLTALRFLTGMGTGGAVPNASALAAEFAPRRWRPTAVKLTVVCVPLGGMLGGVLAAWALPKFGWRGLYAIGGALPLLLAGTLWAFLAESPRFLARRPSRWGHLARLLGRMGHTGLADAQFEDRAEPGSSKRASLRALFAPEFARDTAGLWLAFFFSLGSIYLVFGWLPEMLRSHGLDVATSSTGLALYNFGGVVGVFVWAALMAHFGSRGPLLLGALASVGSALALLAVPVQASGDHIALMACLGMNGLIANAIQTSMYGLAAHVYPTGVRATGVAYAATLGRIGGLVSSLVGAAFIQGQGRAYWYALAISMVFTFAGLAWIRHHYPAIRKLR
ncbi:MAG TPA: MFS transporter [Bryobacteraceae bacterium]|nr:MFS transporter [Bryobacteraceae bacterium]